MELEADTQDDAQHEASESRDEQLQELESYLSTEINDAINYIDLEIAPERAQATRFYRGDPYGDEEDGRSQVVTTEVRDTVQAIMPSLMRCFFGTQDVVEFVPTGEKNAEFAEQATALVHHVVLRQNPGFNVFYSAFKDALVRKTGFVKWWWEESLVTKIQTRENVTQEELDAITGDYPPEDIEIIAHTTRNEPVTRVQMVQDPRTGQPVQQPFQTVEPVSYFTVRITQRHPKGQAKLLDIPPEEILVNRGAVSITEARIVSHRTLKTRQELLAMGIPEDKLEEAAGGSGASLLMNQEARARQPGLSRTAIQNVVAADEDAELIEFFETYCRRDMDGDGVPELYRVWSVGGGKKVVAWEPVEEIPIRDFCPDPEPHVWAGSSFADRVMDVQLIDSHVLRDVLDSLKASIFPRTVYVEGQVNVDDVLNTEIGAAIRARAPGMVATLETPFVGAQALPVMELLKDVLDRRTGVTNALALDASALQSTNAAAAQATVMASQQMVELVARIFAEGVRDVFRGVLRLLCRHADRETAIRLRGKWVAADPREWDPEMDVEINVALGMTSAQDQMARLGAVMAKQELILQNSGGNSALVPMEKYLAALRKMTELAGFRGVSAFWPTADEMKQAIANQPPPPPTPEQVLAEIEDKKTMAKIVLDYREQDLRRLDLMLSDDRERDKLDADVILRAADITGRTGAAVDVAQIKALVDHHRTEKQAEVAAARPIPGAT